MHHTITLQGAERRTPEEQQQSATEAIQRLGRSVEGFELIHLKDFKPLGMSYRVDLHNGKLIAVPDHPRKERVTLTGAGM